MKRRIVIRRRLLLKIDAVKRGKGSFRMKTNPVRLRLEPQNLGVGLGHGGPRARRLGFYWGCTHANVGHAMSVAGP